jgi:hypothetical protein
MKKTDSMKDMILIKKLKAEDHIELPMDEMFFEDLHNKIMMSVEKTEIKPASKWTKTWVFLEQKTINQRAKMKKAVKLGITATTLTLGVSLLNYSLNLSKQIGYASAEVNKTSILSEAQKNPSEWSELVVNYQSENDFYADVLSQRDLKTMVEIDQVISQSL